MVWCVTREVTPTPWRPFPTEIRTGIPGRMNRACLWRISIHYEYLGQSLAPNISFIAPPDDDDFHFYFGPYRRPAASLMYPTSYLIVGVTRN